MVPFRLTPNMVDALGVTGVEGGFRRVMEVTLGLLRTHSDALLSVLEPFLRDPTVAWARMIRSAGGGGGGRGDQENPDAKDALKTVEERLQGIYNLMHPLQQRITEAYRLRKQTVGRGIGSTRAELKPLSVQGQLRSLLVAFEEWDGQGQVRSLGVAF